MASDQNKASATIGYFSLGVGIYFGRISLEQDVQMFGKHLHWEYGIQFGFGAELSVEKKEKYQQLVVWGRFCLGR